VKSLAEKHIIIQKLQQDILLLQRFATGNACDHADIGLGMVEKAFPNGIFPTGTVHEFLSFGPEQAAASGGFIAGLMSTLMKKSGVCIWIGTSLKLFPPALKLFCVEPHKIVFIKLLREKDVLWATEEALKCKGISAVITEVDTLSFMQSRRLQLAVEASKVTSFILRTNERKLCTTACTARWQITPIASQLEDGMPGVGFPRWQVDLLKVRNGKPGSWQLEWSAGKFTLLSEKAVIEIPSQIRKAG
jgi:protein ImuA